MHVKLAALTHAVDSDNEGRLTIKTIVLHVKHRRTKIPSHFLTTTVYFAS